MFGTVRRYWIKILTSSSLSSLKCNIIRQIKQQHQVNTTLWHGGLQTKRNSTFLSARTSGYTKITHVWGNIQTSSFFFKLFWQLEHKSNFFYKLTRNQDWNVTTRLMKMSVYMGKPKPQSISILASPIYEFGCFLLRQSHIIIILVKKGKNKPLYIFSALCNQ